MDPRAYHSPDVLRAALQAADIGVWQVDMQSGVATWDPVAAKLFGGLSPPHAAAMDHGVFPEDRDRVAAFFQAGSAFASENRIEFRIRAPNDTVRWLECIGCPLNAENGESGQLVGLVRDATARKRAEVELEQSRRQLDTLVRNLPGIAYSCEPKTPRPKSPRRIFFISSGALELTGYTPEELEQGKPDWLELVHPDDVEEFTRQVEIAIAERRPLSLTYRITGRDGHIRWVTERSAIVTDKDGHPLSLEGFIWNVSDQALARAELQHSKNLLETVIEAIPDGVYLKDYTNDGRYVVVNSATERLVGRTSQEIVGRSDYELFPQELADSFAEEDRIIINGEKPHFTMEQSFETPIGQRIIEVRKFPIREFHSQTNYVLGIVRDRTEQRGLEEQLKRVQRMEAVGQLTGGVAHDFNNLLAITMAYGEILRERVGHDQALVGIVDRVLEATQRGADLVSSLLAFARQQRLEPRTVDLNERLPGILSLLQRTLGENIRIHLLRDPNLWPALIDPNQFDNALVNLAINARDAMPNGGTLTIETVNVHMEADYIAQHIEVQPGDYIMLAVSDTGIGMTPEVLARAFEPFFTTKEPGRGTGLGLSMVYGFIKQSGGHVSIHSEAGLGTTIKLYLPRAAGVSDQTQSRSTSAPAMGRETILLVEDNADVRQATTLQLRALGYKVVEAENAVQALALLDSGVAIDLMFTDIMMPGGMTGFDLAGKARQKWPDLKLLFASGYVDVAAGNVDVRRYDAELLSKPYRKEDLARAIRAALGKQ